MTRILQSFWSRPIFESSNNHKGIDRLKGGWIDHKAHIMSWALSCLQLKKFYDDVWLITDEFGKALLIDLFKLPYTTCVTKLNDLDSYHPDLWALGKIYTYGYQDRTFIHVDGDVFIFKKFISDLESSPLICQNFDVNNNDYTRILKEMDKHIFYYPDSMKIIRRKEPFVVASNAGIIGGTKTSFFKEFSKLAFEFVDLNIHKLDAIHIPSFNIIFEQYLFYCLAKINSIDITPFFKNPDVGKDPSRFIRFHEVPYRSNYIHMISTYKQNPILVNRMESLLRLLYPDYYYNIKSITENIIFKI